MAPLKHLTVKIPDTEHPRVLHQFMEQPRARHLWLMVSLHNLKWPWLPAVAKTTRTTIITGKHKEMNKRTVWQPKKNRSTSAATSFPPSLLLSACFWLSATLLTSTLATLIAMLPRTETKTTPQHTHISLFLVISPTWPLNSAASASAASSWCSCICSPPFCTALNPLKELPRLSNA